MHEYAYDHIYYCAYDHDDGHVYVHDYHYDRGCVHVYFNFTVRAYFNYSPSFHAHHEYAYPFFCDRDYDFSPLYHDDAFD
jgi:hypothetical protein